MKHDSTFLHWFQYEETGGRYGGSPNSAFRMLIPRQVSGTISGACRASQPCRSRGARRLPTDADNQPLLSVAPGTKKV